MMAAAVSDVPADEGFLSDKTDMLGAAIKTPFSNR
jgi:hypothetical protein